MIARSNRLQLLALARSVQEIGHQLGIKSRVYILMPLRMGGGRSETDTLSRKKIYVLGVMT